MRTRGVAIWILAVVVGLIAWSLRAEEVPAETEVPYANTPEAFVPYSGFGEVHRILFPERLPFLGTGAEEPEPKGVEEVLIGLLVPPKVSPIGSRAEA